MYFFREEINFSTYPEFSLITAIFRLFSIRASTQMTRTLQMRSERTTTAERVTNALRTRFHTVGRSERILLSFSSTWVVDRTKTTQESTDIVLSKCLTQLSTPARLRLPPLDHVKRTIRHHRKENDLPSIPNDVNFPSVPSILKFTKRNELFLRIDTGPGKWYTAHKGMMNI